MADNKENVGDKLYDGVRDFEDALGIVDKDEKEQGGPSREDMISYRKCDEDELREKKEMLKKELAETDDAKEKKVIQGKIDMIDELIDQRQRKGEGILKAIFGKETPEMEGPDK